MNADISLAAPDPVLPPLRAPSILSAIIPVFAVTFLSFCSFGLVLDLIFMVVARAVGLPDVGVWTVGAMGAVCALGLSLWLGVTVWRDGEGDSTVDA